MSATVPITVGIPTYSRGDCVLQPIEYILACNPAPAEILVHIDASDGVLEQRLRKQFPNVRILTSPKRIGPGGGRHRCLMAATQPYFASFDDDSWPVDSDFFDRVMAHFTNAPQIGCLATIIGHRNQVMPPSTPVVTPTINYTGCGCVLRRDAYLRISGYVDRPNAYGLEEKDVCLQMYAQNIGLIECNDLRVFHDTDLSHHSRPEITAAMIENAALFAFLRYPILLWPYGLLQYVNQIWFLIKFRRFKGILTGIVRSPVEMWSHRHLRTPFSFRVVTSYLRSRR